MAKTEVEVVIKGTDKASGVMGKIGKAAKGLGIGIAAIGTAAIGMGIASVKSFAEAGDEVQKMALKTGFSTEALSELKHAAELSGTSIEGIEKGIKRMSGTIEDAWDGLSTATDAFDKLGVSVEDLADLNPEDTFAVLTKAIADIDDPLQKAALAQDIFGKSGVDLLPMLAQGADGLADMKQEAHDLGLVFSQEAADSAAEFNDNITRLQGAFTGLMNELAQALMPALEALMPVLIDLVKALPIEEIGKLVSNLLPPLVDLFLDLLDAIPLDTMIDFVTKALGPIMQILTAVMSIASPLLRLLEPVLDILILILDVLQPIFDLLAWIIEGVGSVLGGVVDWIGGAVSGFAGDRKMASGGIVTGPTRALIGEAGPEAVIPLGGGGMFGDTINIVVEGSTWGEGELVERLRREFIDIKTNNTTTGF